MNNNGRACRRRLRKPDDSVPRDPALCKPQRKENVGRSTRDVIPNSSMASLCKWVRRQMKWGRLTSGVETMGLSDGLGCAGEFHVGLGAQCNENSGLSSF